MARERIRELEEALLDMLHQHGDNSALSANQLACRVLGHPRTSAPYDGKTCYCHTYGFSQTVRRRKE